MAGESRRLTLAAFLTTLLMSGWAWGWNQSTTNSGEPLSWNRSCVYWTMVDQGINNRRNHDDPVQPLLSFRDLHGAVAGAFTVWEEEPCSYFTFVETEPGTCLDVGYHNGSGNANRVFFRSEGWLDPNAPWRTDEQIALTSVFYDTQTGEIFDVDIEVNAEFFELTTTLENPRTDIQNALAHEVGHLLGLEHSEDREATMYRSASDGETSKRDLAPDDVAGLCAIYPVADDPGRCTEPRGGLDIDCDTAEYCVESDDGTVTDCGFSELVCCCDEQGGVGTCSWRSGGDCGSSDGNAIYQLDQESACDGERPSRQHLCCCQTESAGESLEGEPQYTTTCSWERYCQLPETVPASEMYDTDLCGARPVEETGCGCDAPGRGAAPERRLVELLTSWLR